MVGFFYALKGNKNKHKNKILHPKKQYFDKSIFYTIKVTI